MAINNNLYPPLIPTYAPAFIKTDVCRIYFSLSVYNTIEEILNAQVIVSNQKTNLSVLNNDIYTSGIKIAPILIDESIKGDYKYYIELDNLDLQNGFELNQFYKIQIRFTSINAEKPPIDGKIASWLVNNQELFSEWSRVCLVKAISKPSIIIRGFEDANETVFTTEIIDFVGRLTFEDPNEEEYMKSYQIKLYKASDLGTVIYDTGEVYTNLHNPNEINYQFKYGLEDGESYRFELIYTTNNLYIGKSVFDCSVFSYGIDKLDAIIEATPKEEIGSISVKILATTNETFLGNLTIRRASNETNFTIWEDVHTTTITDENNPLNYQWEDFTVKSGIFYKYCAQKRNTRGDRGVIIQIKHPVMVLLEDMYLGNKNLQLRIKYNPKLSSFKRVVSESKTETIGGKYPFVRRNGNLNYKEFPISGTITHFCDEEGLFLNKTNIYGESIFLYREYEEERNITPYNDFLYEREFREKVMDFLMDKSVKLFRSTTEGNILVKLMDVNFTPEEVLGRMIYSFSATVVEIDEATLDNYSKYDIQTIGDYSEVIERTYLKTGQLSKIFSPMPSNAIDDIREKYKNEAPNNFDSKIEDLKWVRLDFISEPYLINTNTLIKITNDAERIAAGSAITYGYLVYINTTTRPIVVNSRGYYELADDDTKITFISFPYETEVNIDYSCNIYEKENIKLPSKLYYNSNVGQLWGSFRYRELLSKQLYGKYYSDYTDYYEKLTSINGISIEATPGTVVYVKDSFDTEYGRHVIGNTGVLELKDEAATISEFYFGGLHFIENLASLDEVRNNEFVSMETTATSLDEIIPVKNGVYTINGIRYIYFNGEWLVINKNNDVYCPVIGLIDYEYESVKGVY